MSDIVDELREIQRLNTTLHGAQMAARAADEIEGLHKAVTMLEEMVEHYATELRQERALAILRTSERDALQAELARLHGNADDGA